MGAGILAILGPFIGKLALYLLNKFIKVSKVKAETLEIYYEFLESLENEGKAQVDGYFAATDAREQTKERIKQRRLAREKASAKPSKS